MTATIQEPTSITTGGEARWFLADLATIRLTAEDTDGRFSLVEMLAPRGDMPPLHVHHVDDETFVLLDGEATLYVGNEVVRAEAGSVVHAPRDVPHTYRVESETARWLVISSPPAFDAFVANCSVPAAAATLPPEPQAIDPERLAALAAEQGIELLGPPGALPTS